MQNETVDRDPLDVLAEQFVEQHRLGNGPTIEQFARHHASYAAEIRELFPAIVGIERLKNQQERVLTVVSHDGRQAERIGDFHIVREIGRGGMGVVYEAEQQSLKRRVALKVLSQNVAGSTRHLQRFRQEAEAAARLHHTNIVPIYGTGHVDGVNFYAMQLIHGVGLDAVVDALRHETAGSSPANASTGPHSGTTVDGRSEASIAWLAAQQLCQAEYTRDRRCGTSASTSSLNGHLASSVDTDRSVRRDSAAGTTTLRDHRYWRTVARIARDVAQAMDYAHRHGVLHRDIKPSNLLLDQEGNVWVADFGLAKHEEGDALTKTGDVIGTLRYMAPEQFHGEVTRRSDVYSLGLTLYELLTLTPMFGDSKQGPLLKQKTNGEFVAPRSIDSQIPADLETITLKASATDAAHRYRTAAEMADDLDRFLDERPILARRISLGERLWRWSRRNPAVASLSSLAVMLLMVIAAILAWANYRTGLALRAAEQQHKRAVDAAGEALREEARAEGNLRLALGAFEGIMENVARRGAPDALEVDLGDGEVVYDVVVSNADAALLQTLLGFYDQFARQNELDLQLETATAYMRVGDIYQRLGDLTAASKAYQAALAVYERLLNSAPDDIQLSLAKAEALNELAISLGRGGELVPATQNHRQAERLLRERPSLMETAAGKFELARTLNLLASRPFVAGHDRVLGALARSQRAGPGRRRGPAGIGGRPPGGPAGPRSGELAVMPESREARELLEQLVRDEPGNPDYRLALAETFQAELRFHQLRGRPADAEETLTEAVQFLQQAARDFPKVPAFQYALADTLSLAMPSGRRHDKSPLQHIERAISIAAKLVMTYPQVPEYRSLQGRLESELAAAQVEAGQLDTAEQHYLAAITQQRSLVDRYESVSLYRLSYAQSLYELAQLQRRRKQFDAARAGLKAAAVQIEPFAQTDQPSRHLCQRFLHQVYQRLATTCRDLDDDTQAEIYAQKAKSLAVMDRVPRMGRFRLRPGDLHRRGWRGFGGEQYRL